MARTRTIAEAPGPGHHGQPHFEHGADCTLRSPAGWFRLAATEGGSLRPDGGLLSSGFPVGAAEASSSPWRHGRGRATDTPVVAAPADRHLAWVGGRNSAGWRRPAGALRGAALAADGRSRRQPPGRETGRGQSPGRQERHRDGGGDGPVVADDEVDPEAGEGTAPVDDDDRTPPGIGAASVGAAGVCQPRTMGSRTTPAAAYSGTRHSSAGSFPGPLSRTTRYPLAGRR
jgi:hypothetical protein